MNVHLVARDYQSDRILGRLARMLSASTGWTLNASPDPQVELNHFLCYIDLAESYNGWHATPISAYFTHLEEKRVDKAGWWETAARQCDLRIATARRYLPNLEGYGKTVLVRPPVDQELFAPQPKERDPRPMVGVSGFIDHRSKRKGEWLISQLQAHPFSRKIKLAAIGFGWPVRDIKQTSEPDADLPAFYHGLDIFLCTSLIEANPMPPLEALACGVPVVIPKDVGMMDDLPDIPGIYRYDKGDFDSMLAALEAACAAMVPQDGLRQAVAQYTPESWANDHIRAFESLLYDIPTIRQDGQRGMYCVGYGKAARGCAEKLISSFRKHMPGVPVAFAGVEGLGVEDYFIECPDVDIGGRHAKLKVDELAPKEWKHIVYLDADTELIADISFLWQALEDGWDFMICKNPGKYHLMRNAVRPYNKDEVEKTLGILGADEIMQLNGGVFGFQRNQRTKTFFETWYGEWQRYGKRDQAAMLRALWRVPLKMVVLGNEWNLVETYDGADICAGIMHYPLTARRWRGVVHARSDDEEAWKQVRKWEAEN